jgi:predicted Zn-ribbon and HTH transcriptional regulator
VFAKISKVQFGDRIAQIVNKLARAKQQQGEARAELTRVFGHKWVDQLEMILDAERMICRECGLDFDDMRMADDRTCLDCSRTANFVSAAE